jgi:hypothetical protein
MRGNLHPACASVIHSDALITRAALVVIVAATNGSIAMKARDSFPPHMMNLGAIVAALRLGPVSHQ